MKIIADLHIHSKYSRACSKNLDLPHLDLWARLKGINIIGTGDFTHPEWSKQIGEQLEDVGSGLFRLRQDLRLKESLSAALDKKEAFFLLTSEISCIYSRGGKVRRVHLLVFAPSIKVVAEINRRLNEIGNLKADGRPILGLDAEKLARLVFEVDPLCLVVPAHAWTPWFAVFGSKSGFDSLEECFGSLTPQIYAIETGLSSDPLMNRRLSQLDDITLISNSDAHSLPNLGREANVLDLAEYSYAALAEAIKTRKGFKETLEFFPEEGKYHLDGHATCKIFLEPEETLRLQGVCPTCKKPLTIGVLNRVAKLADRKASAKDFSAHGFVPYRSIVPLAEVIADALGKKRSAKAVQEEYSRLLASGFSEFDILLELPQPELQKITTKKITEGILRVRQGQVQVSGGYDGVYGTVKIFGAAAMPRQSGLF